MNKKYKKIKISVIGSGSWGGTLAWLLSKKNHHVTLWCYTKNEYDFITKYKTLPRPKKLKLNKFIHVTKDLSLSVHNADLIIMAVPTNAIKETAAKIKKTGISKKTILLSATKGITTKENLRPSVILSKYFPANPVAVLSGPNIALDVITSAPIISVVATKSLEAGRLVQEIISSKNFRIYLNNDIAGVEIAGALKNVIAIAAGMSDGFGFGTSTKASLISRGLAEITKIAIKEGAKPLTLLGASGIGDLIATCCSTDSRNYKVGYGLAKGKKLKTVLKEIGQVAEGVETVKSMINLARRHKVNIPIATSIYEILIKNNKPKTVLKKLLNRPLPHYEFEF